MELTFEATYDGEVFRPDEKIDLEPNTKVTVTVEKQKKLNLVVKQTKKTDKKYSFADYAKSVSIDAPPDYASNIDHYLYGDKSLNDK